MNNVVIDINDVSFSFGVVPVLEHVSLKIYEGEFIGVIGPNGSGKTTLLKLILGLLSPEQGVIKKSLAGHACSLNAIGYVPQHESFARYFPITVGEVVMMGNVTRYSRLYRFDKNSLTLANRIMQMLEIDNISKRQIRSLSGGQLQRVLMARALMCQPSILILDEPTSSVDIKAEQSIFELLKHHSDPMTILVVSHDISFIFSYVDRVACLNRTLVCHNTESISGKMIEDLYQVPVNAIRHH